MAGFSLLQTFKNASIAKKLYFTVGIMAMLIALELGTLWFANSTLSSVRAFINGEGLWSKGEKDAINALHRYARSGKEAVVRGSWFFVTRSAMPLSVLHSQRARQESQRQQGRPSLAAA